MFHARIKRLNFFTRKLRINLKYSKIIRINLFLNFQIYNNEIVIESKQKGISLKPLVLSGREIRFNLRQLDISVKLPF